MAETFTLYKLIVLYMLDRVDFPLTTSQISEFILDKGYTTYFRLQSALAELTDSGLLKIELTHNRTLYNLTEEGAATINYFRNKISPEIRQEIDNFINEKKYDLKEEVSVKSDYYLNTNHEYEVKCQILENGSHLIDMTLTVPTQTEAEAIVNNWNRKNQEIYALLLSQLLLFHPEDTADPHNDSDNHVRTYILFRVLTSVHLYNVHPEGVSEQLFYCSVLHRSLQILH